MLKQFLSLSVASLVLVGCQSSSEIIDNQAEVNSEIVDQESIEQSIPDLTETETIIIDQLNVQQCDLEFEIQKLAINTINQIRSEGRNCGSTFYPAADPVIWSDLLSNAAKLHSEDMAVLNFFSHTGSNGSSIGDRVSDAGYVWQVVGENISAGRHSLQDTINGWVTSSGHCANIMNPSFLEMAISCSENSTSTYGVYWTQVFAKQR